jgi:hypothetical protein
MTTAAFALMKHAADNRQAWLTRFYQIGKEAVRPRKNGETYAYIIKRNGKEGFLLNVLERAGVEVNLVGKFNFSGVDYEDYTPVIFSEQPYWAFAQALIKVQGYPNLLDEKKNPIQPYDVTAHNLALLTGVERVTRVTKSTQTLKFPKPPEMEYGVARAAGCRRTPATRWIYKSHTPSMDEGWTRWSIEKHRWLYKNEDDCEDAFKSVSNAEIRGNNFDLARAIVFPDQSPNQILNGYAKGSMPEELTGGVGKEGVENLRKFVEAGGTLVFLNRAANFAIEQFDLPVREVTQGLDRRDFYIPGSILRTELDTTHPVAKGMDKSSIAWFENSPAFEIKTDPLALNNNFRIIARYPDKPEDVLLSGWQLGAEKIAGKAALVEFKIGKGKIYLFGFRPQYRGQSLATFPLLFNAITER